MNQAIVRTTGPAPSTKDRILDAAAALFARHGFDGTSLRMITAAARVNLAAVNYHFHSKDALLHAVFNRGVGPVNERRFALLEQFEAGTAPKPCPIEKVLEALISPVFELGADLKHFGPLMARLIFFERDDVRAHFVQEHLGEVFRRFGPAILKALPHLTPDEAFLRVHFATGAMAQAFLGRAPMFTPPGMKPDLPPLKEVQRRLIVFLSAGLRAPAIRPRKS